VQVARREPSLAELIAGINKPASNPIITITTNNSINVKPTLHITFLDTLSDLLLDLIFISKTPFVICCNFYTVAGTDDKLRPSINPRFDHETGN
jgi:hypothetical protein